MTESIETAVRAARATLCALRAVCFPESESRLDGYLILPDMIPLPEEEVVRRLAELSKPIACMGVAFGSALALGCWPESPLTTSFKAQQSSIITRVPPDPRAQIDGGVRFHCSHNHLILTSEEFDTWFKSYDLLFTDFTVDTLGAGSTGTKLIRFSQSRGGGLSGLERRI